MKLNHLHYLRRHGYITSLSPFFGCDKTHNKKTQSDDVIQSNPLVSQSLITHNKKKRKTFTIFCRWLLSRINYFPYSKSFFWLTLLIILTEPFLTFYKCSLLIKIIIKLCLKNPWNCCLFSKCWMFSFFSHDEKLTLNISVACVQCLSFGRVCCWHVKNRWFGWEHVCGARS